MLELHSLSKAASIAGWRVGFAVGSAAWISRPWAARQATDFGLLLPIQRVVNQMLPLLEAIAASATALGWPMRPPEGTFFLWAGVPPCFWRDDVRAMHHLLPETSILVAPTDAGSGHRGAAMSASPWWQTRPLWRPRSTAWRTGQP